MKNKKVKSKYWYNIHTYECVVCGKQTKHRTRTYIKREKGNYFYTTVCDYHFL